MALVRMKRAGDSGSEGLEAVQRLWTLALARAAQVEMGVALRLVSFAMERRTIGELIEMLPEPALICALDEGAGEATGVAVIDAGLMAGMVEALTTGTISVTERSAARRATRTDAALLAPVLEHALAGFEAAAIEADLPEWARGFRFAATVDGGRGLSLLLDDMPYRLLIAEVELAGGARSGRFLLALPDGRGAMQGLVKPAPDGRFSQDLAAQVGGAEVRLEAVLMRLSLTLGTVMALQVGQDLMLPRAEIGRIGMEGLDGRKVAVGRLGRQGSLRAVRLTAEAVEAPLHGLIAPAVAERRS
jgi:flagellar motor switch protein FliM